MGIYINGDRNDVNVYGDVYGDSYGGPPRPPVGFFGLIGIVMIFLWVIVEFWWVFLIAACVGTVAFAVWLVLDEKRHRELEARRREEALQMRAERQNSAYLNGYEWGLYGNFPPPPEVQL